MSDCCRLLLVFLSAGEKRSVEMARTKQTARRSMGPAPRRSDNEKADDSVQPARSSSNGRSDPPSNQPISHITMQRIVRRAMSTASTTAVVTTQRIPATAAPAAPVVAVPIAAPYLCDKCGTAPAYLSQFCNHCGNALAPPPATATVQRSKSCPSCRSIHPASTLYCNSCGRNMSAVPLNPIPKTASPASSKPIPADVIRSARFDGATSPLSALTDLKTDADTGVRWYAPFPNDSEDVASFVWRYVLNRHWLETVTASSLQQKSRLSMRINTSHWLEHHDIKQLEVSAVRCSAV